MEKLRSRSLRVSPNELERAVQEERNKWKIFRIQQVREQAKEEAKRIREAVHNKESQMVQDLRKELYCRWQAEKGNQVQKLQQEYKESLQALGQAHKLANEQPDVSEVLAQRAQFNQQKALKRGGEAGKAHREQRLQQEHGKNKLLKQRQDALNWEKLRASRIASLPTPKAYKKKMCVHEKKVPTVQFYEAGTLTTTSYVPKNVIIEKELKSTKPNAKQVAVAEEMARLAGEEAKRQEAEEETRKGEQRGREALDRERLCRMYEQLMSQLDQAQHDHQLSSYLKGTDLSVYETEEAKLNHQASLQRQMEKAVENVLQEDTSLSDVRHDSIRLAADPSGLIDGDTSRVSFDQSSYAKVQDLKSLLDRIRQQRRDTLRDIYGFVPEEEESEEDVDKKDNIVDEHEIGQPRKGVGLDDDEDARKEIDSQDKEAVNIEGSGPQIDKYRKSRMDVEIDGDIHMAETVPADLLPGYHDGKITNIYKPLFQEVSSGDTEITIDISGDGSTQISDNEQLRPMTPMVQSTPKDPVEYSSSESGSTDFRRLPSSLISRKAPVQVTKDSLSKTQPQRQYLSSRPLSKDDQDIHMAETVPFDFLQKKYDGKNTIKSSKSVSQPSSFQESSSDDIEIKIKIIGNGSTLKTITPSGETSVSGSSSADHSISGTRSTVYISPPSSLPKTKVPNLELQDNIRRIQEQRQSIQHMLDSLSKPNEHSSLLKSASPSAYFEKMKEEGSGKRPLKRIDKFEMQKKQLLHYYLKKLLNMKGNELINISTSTVEGSGFSVDSLGTLLDAVQEKNKSVSSSEMSSTSVKEMSEVSYTSSYKDIDDIPVKLSSVSSAESEYSSNDMDTLFQASEPPEADRVQHTTAFAHSRDGSITGHEFPAYLQSSRESVPCTPASLTSQSDESRSSSISTKSIQNELEKLSQLRKELLTHKNIFQEFSSTKVPTASSQFHSSKPDVVDMTPTTFIDDKQEQKVTFGTTPRKVYLSTIYEDSSDLSEIHYNTSDSGSYQTPSREYESTLDDDRSQISLLQKEDLRTYLESQGAKPVGEVSVTEETATEEDMKKFMHLHTHMTLQSRFRYLECALPEGRLKKISQRNYHNIDASIHMPVPKEKSIHMPLPKEKSILMPLPKESTNYSRIRMKDNSSHEQSSLSASPSFATESLVNSRRSVTSLPIRKSDQVETEVKNVYSKSTQGLLQEGTLDLTNETSRFFPLDVESTLTSSVGDISLKHQIPYQGIVKGDLNKGSSKSSSDSSEKQGVRRNGDSSSDSVTSMPDMAEILQRFGLAWAQSMMRKMERTEQKSSSDISSSQENG
nr:uncharacterized protein LOC123772101 isoform X1 [Procambarus clarkii]